MNENENLSYITRGDVDMHDEKELWNEAGINGESFKTNADDDIIEETLDALIVIGQEDARHLKESLENRGWLCGEITQYPVHN